jgi:hypothetical protein
MVLVLWRELLDSVMRPSTCTTVAYVSEMELFMSRAAPRLTLFIEAFNEFGKDVEAFRESGVDL